MIAKNSSNSFTTCPDYSEVKGDKGDRGLTPVSFIFYNIFMILRSF